MKPIEAGASAGPIGVGVLYAAEGEHSTTEEGIRDAVLMAIAQINAAGGLLGRRIEPVVQGSEATPASFGAHLRQLLGRDRVTTVFSGGNAASRRAMVPIIEASAALLWYPWDYEGLESSRHIFYGGGCPNQIGEAIAAWLLRSGAQRVYLLGQGDALTRTLRAILSVQLAQQGGQWAGEVQVSPAQLDFGDAIAQIDRASPDLVISTLHGDSQRAFWGHYSAAGKTAGQTAGDRPILSVHLSEAELLTLCPAAVGHYAVQRYFQSLDLPENQRFVEQFQAHYGHHRPLTSAIATAYTQVHLWAQAVALAQSLDSDRVSSAAIGLTWASPLGTVTLLPNRHLQQPYRLAQALPHGQFAASLTSEPLRPLPWLGLEETPSPAVAIAQQLLDDTAQLTERVQQLEQHNHDLTTALEQAQQLNQRELTATAPLSPDLPLLQSVAGLRSILAAMNELIVIYNPAGRCLHVLSGYTNALRATPQTWVGQSLDTLYPPNCAQAIGQSIEQTLAQQRLVELEYVFPAAEGDRWFAAQFTPISAAAVLCVTRDITEQKQAEAALQQSEERFRSIVFYAAIAIGLTDLNGNLLDCNPSALDMFGYTFEEFRSLSFVQYTHPDDLSLDLELYRELISGKRDSYQVEKRYIRKNGEIFWGRLTVCAIAGPDGQAALTFGMVENISDYKQAQDALQLSETRFRTIVANLPGAVYRGTHSLEWEDEFMSAAIADITGYPVTEFLPLGDRTFGSIVYPPDRERIYSEEGEALQAQRPFTLEYRIICADGSVRWVQEKGQGTFSETGELRWVDGVIFDITKRKTAEAALRASLNQLAIANQEITQLNKRLQRENLRMAAALEITRQLQQFLLPNDSELQEIRDLEIVGFMQPADEVGGDYYDVLQHNGRVKIGIGDVSGHGLESGVVMLMVQTAVRTLLVNDEIDPTRFLNALNRTLYHNIQRMSADHHVTLTLLDYQHGTLRLSGQHEDVLLVRNGTVERIDTLNLGVPLGLEPNIAAFVEYYDIHLERGDGIVLYTDGITDAENSDRQRYGLDRLCAVIGQHWGRSPKVVQEAIISDVMRHIGDCKIEDDITLLILQQK